MISFHAETFSVTREKWGWMVAWSGRGDAVKSRYLMLQRADEPVKDFRAEMERVYIECCGQGWAWYGHILSFEFLRDRVRVQLDAEAAEDMETDGRIEVTFDLEEEGFEKLRGALGQIFRGYDYYKDMNLDELETRERNPGEGTRKEGLPRMEVTSRRQRNRLWYAVAVLVVIATGLLWRSGVLPLPHFLVKYGGDALWALLVFLGFGWVFARSATWRIAILALGFAWGVEFLQLYHAPWIEGIRATRVGRLVLGATFNWSDLVAYVVGIGLGVWGECWIFGAGRRKLPGL